MSLRFKELINTVVEGDALSVLKTFPDECISACITSPPYWSLRDYSTPPLIWDGNLNCKHEWKTQIKKWHGDRGEGKRKEVFDDNFQVEGTKSDFCIKCGAWKGSLGLEPTFDLFIKHLCDIFDEVKRVLRKDGTVFVVIGDTYSANRTYQVDGTKQVDGSQPRRQPQAKNYDMQSKCLLQIPSRFAIEMCNRGWILRNTIIWKKDNAMPSSANDRFTVDFEYVYFFSKNKKYWFEQQLEEYTKPLDRWGGPKTKVTDQSKGDEFAIAVREGREHRPNSSGRNKRCVWNINTEPFKQAHFAVFPPKLVEPMILAGCPKFVCTKCGKAREKMTKQGEFIKTGGKRKKDTPGISEKAKKEGTGYHLTETIGYTDCGCGAKFEPGIVADPFAGASTTLKVAQDLGRRYIGIELNPEYIKIGNRRLSQGVFKF